MNTVTTLEVLEWAEYEPLTNLAMLNFMREQYGEPVGGCWRVDEDVRELRARAIEETLYEEVLEPRRAGV